MIKPTIGRVVHYFPHVNDHVQHGSGPLAAIVTEVHDDRCVNLAIFDNRGRPLVEPPTSIPLVQPEDPVLIGCSIGYCTWMPYQVKKDTGSESGEREAGTEHI